jgi:hypothetical protein
MLGVKDATQLGITQRMRVRLSLRHHSDAIRAEFTPLFI